MPRLALVTGAHGFIGRHVCRALAALGVTVRGVGHGAWSADQASGWGISRWLESDIDFRSLSYIQDHDVPDAVIHCAGSGSVSDSYSAPYDDYQRSVSTVAALLEHVRTVGTGKTRVVVVSSAAVYGDQGDADLVETSACSPISPYGVHKRAAEELCISYSRFFDLNVSIVRLFSVYGEGLRKQLLWDAALKFSRGEPEFFGTGHELRDWIHVDDASRLLCAAALEPQAKLEIFNGAGAKATTTHVLTRLSSALGSRLPPRFSGETHTGNPRRLTADGSHAQRQLAWTPLVSLDSGLARYGTWFKTLDTVNPCA